MRKTGAWYSFSADHPYGKEHLVTESLFKGSFGPALGSWKGIHRLLLLGVLFASALGIRLYHISDPPLEFHPTRQYRSALIARAVYFETEPGVAEQDRMVTEAARPALLEPPFVEYIAAFLYRAAGAETLVLPRLMSVIFWLVAAVFLYRICILALSPQAALVATGYFLFVPFGVVASRSFQPDPLMIMAFLGSIWIILRYRQSGSGYLLYGAAIFSAVAILIKPICLFAIWCVFLLTGKKPAGPHAGFSGKDTFIFIALSALPPALFYGWGLFVAEFLEHQAVNSFAPYLLIEGAYWQSWFSLASDVIGPLVLFLALVSVALMPRSLGKQLLLGLWCGYFLFGLVFSFHIHTHDYYHLMLVPIAAISLGAGAAVLMRALTRVNPGWRWSFWVVMVFILIFYVIGIKPRLENPSAESLLQAYEEIGRHVGHGGRTAFLTENYGMPLMYYGKLAGIHWPYLGDIRVARRSGRPIPQGKDRLDSLINRASTEYFIVTDYAEFNRQPELKSALDKFPVRVTTDQYRIYELGK